MPGPPPPDSNEEAPLPTSSRRKARIIALVVAVGLIAGIGVYFVSSRTPQPPPIPDPNGYDRLVDAALMIDGGAPNEGSIIDADPDELRAWVEANREALAMADEGLGLPSAVPLTFDPTQRDLERTMADLGPFRMLGRLILADLIVSQGEGKHSEAAGRAIDAIRLAHRISRNGLILHRQAGTAIERTVGLEGLRIVRDDLDGPTCLELSRALLRIDEEAPGPEETLALEAAWVDATLPRGAWISRALIPGVEARLRALQKPSVDALRDALLVDSTQRRLMATDLAIRAYRDHHDGRLPERLNDLVPEYLPGVPTDPGSGKPPLYEPGDDGDSFVLLFLGPDE
jgi:hypothetical protein